MPRPGLTPASRPAPDRSHRGRGAEVDRKQLKPITTQDPYTTEPRPTERECVCAAGRGPSETGFGGAEKELLCLRASSLKPLQTKPASASRTYNSTLSGPRRPVFLPGGESETGSTSHSRPSGHHSAGTATVTLPLPKELAAPQETTKSRERSVASCFRVQSSPEPEGLDLAVGRAPLRGHSAEPRVYKCVSDLGLS